MDKDLTYEEDQKRRLLQVLGPLQCFDVAFALATAPREVAQMPNQQRAQRPTRS